MSYEEHNMQLKFTCNHNRWSLSIGFINTLLSLQGMCILGAKYLRATATSQWWNGQGRGEKKDVLFAIASPPSPYRRCLAIDVFLTVNEVTRHPAASRPYPHCRLLTRQEAIITDTPSNPKSKRDKEGDGRVSETDKLRLWRFPASAHSSFW